MATRRLPSEKSSPRSFEDERIVTPAHPGTNSNTTPAVPVGIQGPRASDEEHRQVIVKLLIATFLMVAAPISVYFLTANTIFADNKSWAGGTAAVTANIVLVGYIIVAVMEDQGEDKPKVGKIE